MRKIPELEDYNDFKKHGKEKSNLYEPDKVISLYREIAIYKKFGNDVLYEPLIYQDLLAAEVFPIEESKYGKKIRKSYLTDGLPPYLKLPPNCQKNIVNILRNSIVGIMSYHAEKTALCSLEEEICATGFLQYLNILIQTCAKKYYSEKVCDV